MSETFQTLIKMKDTSELMVDLAYSALLFNNRSLAEKVHSLEDYTDKLYSKMIELALDMKKGNEPEMAKILIRLATGIEAIADCAKEIADVVLRDIEPHPVLKKSIKESDTGIFLNKVHFKSIIVDMPIGKTGIAQEMGIWILAIQQESRWIVGPDENSILRSGDILVTRGPTGSKKKFAKLTSGKIRSL